MTNRQTNSNKFLDASLFYGLPGIVIMAVSLMAAVKTGADFGGDGMVRTGTFLECNLLLWLSYYTLFISLPESLAQCFGKRDKVLVTSADISEAISITDVPALEKPIIASEPEKEDEESDEETPSTEGVSILEDHPVTEPSVQPIVTLDYRAICLEHEQRQMAERSELIEDIIEHTSRTMAPFVSETNMIRLCEEIICWCSNPQYERMEHCEKRFKSEQLDAFAAIYNDSTTLYLDLQDTSLLLQKSGYSTNPVREQRLLIAALQYATVSDNAHLSIMEKLTDSIAQEEKNVYDRAEKLRDIIADQRQRLIDIDREISSITPSLSNKTAVSKEEINNFRHRLNVLTEESSSRSRLIENLLLWAF